MVVRLLDHDGTAAYLHRHDRMSAAQHNAEHRWNPFREAIGSLHLQKMACCPLN